MASLVEIASVGSDEHCAGRGQSQRVASDLIACRLELLLRDLWTLVARRQDLRHGCSMLCAAVSARHRLAHQFRATVNFSVPDDVKQVFKVERARLPVKLCAGAL